MPMEWLAGTGTWRLSFNRKYPYPSPVGFLGSTPLPKCMCIVYIHSPAMILVSSKTEVLAGISNALPWNSYGYFQEIICNLDVLVTSSVDFTIHKSWMEYKSG